MSWVDQWAGRLRARLERDGGRRLTSGGWAIGAAGYFVGIVIYVAAVVIVQIANLGGASFSESLYLLLGRNLVVACPALITCVNLAVRAGDHAHGDDARSLVRFAVAGCALLGPALAVGVLLGGVGAIVEGGSAGSVLVAFLIQVAGCVVAAAASVWALSQVPASGSSEAAPA